MSNTARLGGGISLETNAKLYVLRHTYNPYNYTKDIIFVRNSADYGGAVYVNDYTNAATCSHTSTEC